MEGFNLVDTFQRFYWLQDTQETYESITATLDTSLDIIKKYNSLLLMLVEAEKSLDHEEFGHKDVLDEIEDITNKYTKLQEDGWKAVAIKDISGTITTCFRIFCDYFIKKCNGFIVF